MNKLISFGICLFITGIAHGMQLQSYKSDTSKAMLTARLFFYNLPAMSPETACLRYNKFNQEVKEKISCLVETNKNKTLKNYISSIGSASPDALGIFFGYLVENAIPSPEKINLYKKMSAWKLYAHIATNQKKQLQLKITQLFPIYTPKRLGSSGSSYYRQSKSLNSDDLKLLPVFLNEFPDEPRSRALRDRPLNYNYKTACNLQEFKTLLKSDFFKNNYYFYLPLYLPIVITLTSWLACQGIKTYFYSDLMANLSNVWIQSEKIRVFNQEAQKYNSWLASNPRGHDILQLKYIPEKILNFDQIEIPVRQYMIIHFPLALQMALAFLLSFSSSYHGDHRNALIRYCAAMLSITLLSLTNEYPSSLVNNVHLASHLIKSIIVITTLYGIYFYKSASSYFNEKHEDTVVCSEEKITELLARTDIQIID